MNTTKDIVGLMEAYTAVYDDDLRDDLDYGKELMEDDLSFIDDLSDNELVQVMEEILSERQYTLDECLDIFDGVLIQEQSILGEARLTPRQQQERQKFKSQQKTQLAASSASAEKRGKQYASAERRTQRVERLKSAAQRAKTLAGGAVSAVAGGARDVGQAAKEKLSQAKSGVQKFLRRAGKQVTTGTERVSRGLQGRDIKTERGQRRARSRMTRVAREKLGKAAARSKVEPVSVKDVTPQRSALLGTPERKALPGTAEKPSRRSPAGMSRDRRILRGAIRHASSAQAVSQGPSAPLPPVGGSSRTQSGARRASVPQQRAFMKAREKGKNLLKKEDFDYILETILEDLIQEGYAMNLDEAYEILEDLTETEFDNLVESYLDEEDVETLDFYDDVLDYLVSEGFAETEEDATAIMANMSEEWRVNIIDVISESEMKPPGPGREIPYHIRTTIEREQTPDPEKTERRKKRGKMSQVEYR